MNVCLSCTMSFITDPLKMGVVAVSLILSIALFILFIKKKKELSISRKLFMVYGSIFFFVFPIIYFLYGRACKVTFLSCNVFQSILYPLPITFLVSILLGFIAVPFIYKFSFHSIKIKPSHYLLRFLEKSAKKVRIKKLKLYLIDKAEPIAFSFSHISPRIFISVGLTEILNKKELQGVLLHELGHIKQKSSFLKFTNALIKLLSPVSSFYKFHEELKEEEEKADKFAAKFQKTRKHLNSAKIKIKNFYCLL